MKNAINVCVLHESITVHCTGPEGQVKGIFLGKDDSCDNDNREAIDK